MSNNYDFIFSRCEEEFDKHICKSIRGYDDLQSDIQHFASYFIREDTEVLDIGCSTGLLIERFARNYGKEFSDVKFVGVDKSSAFSDDSEKRINDMYEDSFFDDMEIYLYTRDIFEHDIENCSLITSIFTMQFMKHDIKQKLLDKIYAGLNQGGALIMSEKILLDNSFLQDAINFGHYDYKGKSFSEKEIIEKEVKLRRFFSLNTLGELKDMLYQSGFSSVDVFWMNFSFVGIIAKK